MAWIIFDLVGIVLLVGFFFGADAALRTALVITFLLTLALVAFFVFAAWFLFGWWGAALMLLLQGAIFFKAWLWDAFCDWVERKASK